MHDVLIIAIPTLAVMLGILLNRQDATSICAEVKHEIGQVGSEIGQLRGETIALRDSIHRDMVSLHERVATVEARQPNN
jgi:hypothetical protein